MKRIYLLRHAQALPSEGGGDIERKLSPKGKEDALALGHYMAKKQYIPDIAVCSSAIRTRQTLEQLVIGLGQEIKTDYNKSVYDSSRENLLQILHDTDTAYASLLIIGHNPGIFELAAQLSTQGSDAHIGRLGQGYPPASLSVLECATDSWDAVTPTLSHIIDLVNPLDYNAPSTPARWT